jgi:hypothetical protein
MRHWVLTHLPHHLYLQFLQFRKLRLDKLRCRRHLDLL